MKYERVSSDCRTWATPWRCCRSCPQGWTWTCALRAWRISSTRQSASCLICSTFRCITAGLWIRRSHTTLTHSKLITDIILVTALRFWHSDYEINTDPASVVSRARRLRLRWGSWATTSWWRRSSCTNTQQTAAKWAKVCVCDCVFLADMVCTVLHKRTFRLPIFPYLLHKHELESMKTWKTGYTQIRPGRRGGRFLTS